MLSIYPPTYLVANNRPETPSRLNPRWLRHLEMSPVHLVEDKALLGPPQDVEGQEVAVQGEHDFIIQLAEYRGLRG